MSAFIALWWAIVLYAVYSMYIGLRISFVGHPWTIRWRFAVTRPLADCWEIAHFLVHSARHRTLVL